MELMRMTQVVIVVPIVTFLIALTLSSYFVSQVDIEKERTKQRKLELCIKLGCTEEQLQNEREWILDVVKRQNEIIKQK